MAKNIGSDQKDQVEVFKLKFKGLQDAFQTESTVEIELAVLRVEDDLQDMKKDIKDMGM